MKPGELADNPFFVLGVAPSASRIELERAAQKLLAQLAIGAAAVQHYASPCGPRPRDETKVRAALAALRDPEQRALHRLWVGEAPPAGEAHSSFRWSAAFRSIGWRPPSTD